MKNKKSVLKILLVNSECSDEARGIAANYRIDELLSLLYNKLKQTNKTTQMENSKRPAFPKTDYSSIEPKTIGGLNKREYFAGLAMQGYLAGQLGASNLETIAKASVLIADHLLKQLETNK